MKASSARERTVPGVPPEVPLQLSAAAARAQVEALADRLGLPIDRGIREPVAALVAVGLPTSQSCEGHLDHGTPWPWIEIQAPYPSPEPGEDRADAYRRTVPVQQRLQGRTNEILATWNEGRPDTPPSATLLVVPMGMYGAHRIVPARAVSDPFNRNGSTVTSDELARYQREFTEFAAWVLEGASPGR